LVRVLGKEEQESAKISHIEIDEDKKIAVAYADEDQLSLAIGKQGQNVRLAAKLTGWKIDVVENKKEDSGDEKKLEEKSKDEEIKEDKE